jgi:hypothetical protein
MVDLTIASMEPTYAGVQDQLESWFELVAVPAECFVWWHCPYGMGTTIDKVKSWKYHRDLVIWVVLDTLIEAHEFDPACMPIPPTLAELELICQQNPDRKFILFSAQRNLQKIFTASNLRVVDLPPDLDMNHNILKFSPVRQQDIDKDRPTLFLNRADRQHRVISLSYFLSQGLDRYCRFTIGSPIGERVQAFDQIQDYCLHSVPNPDLWAVLDQGFQQIKSLPNYNTEIDQIYQDVGFNANLQNYQQWLMPRYSQTCLEIVSHSIFVEPTPHLSEKNFQSILGRNMPLYLAPQGTVAWMRNHGFDMFDDVINHDYDNIVGTVERIVAVFELNRDLLQNPARIVEVWLSSQDRLDRNIDHVPVFFANCKAEAEHQFRTVLTDWGVGR